MTLSPIPPRISPSSSIPNPVLIPELERVIAIYNTVGGVMADSAFLGFDAKAMAGIEQLAMDCSGAFQSGVGHRQHILMWEKQPKNDGGKFILNLVQNSGVLAQLEGIVGVELVPHASFVNISKPGEGHPPHRDWSFNEPSWITLVKQFPAECEPLFRLRHKTSRQWETVDQRGDKWLLLDGFTEHLVLDTPQDRRSLAIGFSPKDPTIALMTREEYFESQKKT